MPDSLLDLWADFDVEHTEELLTRPRHMVSAIVRGMVFLPPPPAKSARVLIRREMKLASTERGWQSLVMRLEAAWVAEFFLARDPAHQGRDARSDSEAEAYRAYEAASWPRFARKAASFPGRPLGGSVDEVAERLSSMWEYVRSAH